MLTSFSRSNRWSLVLSLLIATVIRMFLVIISYGCKVPAGIFVPSMAIGATFGRTVGILVQALHETFPHSRFFASCAPDVPCITPGTYAFLGAGAALSGIMHITVSVVVIMFELTGALTYILPTMIVVGVTKAVSDRLSHGGIADRMIWFNGFPFLDNKDEHGFGVPVSQVMTTHLATLPATDITLHEVEALLSESAVQGFPIVESRSSKTLIGYIGHTELRYAIDRAKREDSSLTEVSVCTFTTNTFNDTDSPTNSEPTSSTTTDFSRFINPTPLTVHPRLPLETVMELFKKVGPRVILVEYHGKLTGLVTVKDCLKFQFAHQAADAGHGHGQTEEDVWVRGWEERIWGWLVRGAEMVVAVVERVSGGRVVLGHAADTVSAGAGARRPGEAVRASGLAEDNRYDGVDELGRAEDRGTPMNGHLDGGSPEERLGVASQDR